MDVREKHAFLYNAASNTIDRILRQEEDDMIISLSTLKKLQESIDIFNHLNDLEGIRVQAEQREAAARPIQ